MTVFVLDISNWQGDVDMSTWPGMNVRGVIAKALEGMTGIDKKWYANKKRLDAMKDRIVPGAYHYINHVHPAADQCKAFLDLVPGDWIHALDAEAPGPLDVDGWFNEYRKHYPNKIVALYTNEPMWTSVSKLPKVDAAARYAPVELWVAGAYRGAYQAGSDDFRKIWGRVPAGADGGLPQLGFETYAIMQYSGSASVPGVSGPCDAGVAGSVDVLKRLAAVNGGSEDMPLTDAEIDKIVAKVWSKQLTSEWNGRLLAASAMLARAEKYAIEGGWPYERVAGNDHAGTPTNAKWVADTLKAITGQTDTLEASEAAQATALAQLVPTLADALAVKLAGGLEVQGVDYARVKQLLEDGLDEHLASLRIVSDDSTPTA